MLLRRGSISSYAAATRSLDRRGCVIQKSARRLPVLICGTEMSYAATGRREARQLRRCSAKSGTDAGHAATRWGGATAR
eukprot:293555-Rhodomonas_salina.1